MKLILFAKHLKGLDVPELVEKAKYQEVDGFDFPVREGFAVNPQNVSTALPELVKAMEAEGLCVPMCTGEGALTDPDATDAEVLLAAMAENQVKLLKLGYFRFNALEQDYWQEVGRARKHLEGWEKLGEKHGVTLCYHTHSGPCLGCTASALMHLIKGFDPQYIGAYLDTGHLGAAGEGFPMACSIVGEYLRIVALKDLVTTWIEADSKRMVRRKAVPFGEGLTDLNEVMPYLVKTGFDGPLTAHIEYEGTQEELIECGRRDVRIFRAALRAAQKE